MPKSVAGSRSQVAPHKHRWCKTRVGARGREVLCRIGANREVEIGRNSTKTKRRITINPCRCKNSLREETEVGPSSTHGLCDINCSVLHTKNDQEPWPASGGPGDECDRAGFVITCYRSDAPTQWDSQAPAPQANALQPLLTENWLGWKSPGIGAIVRGEGPVSDPRRGSSGRLCRKGLSTTAVYSLVTI